MNQAGASAYGHPASLGGGTVVVVHLALREEERSLLVVVVGHLDQLRLLAVTPLAQLQDVAAHLLQAFCASSWEGSVP